MTRHPFFGRDSECDRFDAIIRDPCGQAILIVGQSGIGKSALAERCIDTALNHPSLRCGCIVEQVTTTDSASAVFELLLDRAFFAAPHTEGSFAPSTRRRGQWHAFLETLRLGKLIQSLQSVQPAHPRSRLIDTLKYISQRLRANDRIIILIDIIKALHPLASTDWLLLIEHLPPQVKLMICLRPDETFIHMKELSILALQGRITFLPPGQLSLLDQHGFDAFIDYWSAHLSINPSTLRGTLSPYDNHPYAIAAVVQLLATGVPLAALPASTPLAVATEQWTQVAQGGSFHQNAQQAIQLFEACAILATPASPGIIQLVAGISDATYKVVVADPFLGSLLDTQDDLCSIYHVILSDLVRAQITPSMALAYHTRAVEAYRSELRAATIEHAALPEAAVRRVADHLLVLPDIPSVTSILTNEITPALLQLGLVSQAAAYADRLLARTSINTLEHADALLNLAFVELERGKLDYAHTLATNGHIFYGRLNRKDGLSLSYSVLAHITSLQGQKAAAQPLFDAAFALALELNDPRRLVQLMTSMAGSQLNHADGDMAFAEELLQMSLQLNDRLGRREGSAVAYRTLGSVFEKQGRVRAAIAMHRKALQVFTEAGHSRGEGQSHEALGSLFADQQEWELAERSYTDALKVWYEHNIMYYALASKLGLARVYCRTNRQAEASALLCASLRGVRGEPRARYTWATVLHILQVMDEEFGDDRWHEVFSYVLEMDEAVEVFDVAEGLGSCAVLYEREGNLDRAIEILRRAAEVAYRTERPELAAQLLDYKSTLLARTGDVVGAADALKQALDGLANSKEKERAFVYLARTLANHYAKCGRLEDGAPLLAEVCDNARRQADQDLLVSVLSERSVYELLAGRHQEARGLVDEATRVSAGMKEVSDSARGSLLLAKGHVSGGDQDWADAAACYQLAAESFLNAGDKGCAAVAVDALAQMHLECGRLEEAKDSMERARSLYDDVGNPAGPGLHLLGQGAIAQSQGKWPEVIRHATAAKRIFEDAGRVDLLQFADAMLKSAQDSDCQQL